MGVAGLAALQLLTLLALANRVPGGVVAVQMGLTFYFVVIALVAAPVALSLLPTLARLHRQGEEGSFHDVVAQGLRFAVFLTVPAAVGLLAISEPLAHLMAVGRMGSGAGTALVATSIATLAPGIIGEAVFLIVTYAYYARDNSRTPLRSMLLQVGTFVVLVVATLLLPSVPVTASLALAFSVSSIVGAWHLATRLSAGHTRTGPRLSSSARRVGLGAVAMAGPVWLVARVVPSAVGGRLGSAIAVVAAAILGAAVYLSLQALWHAPELAWLGAGLSRLRARGGASGRRARVPHGGAR
jgi:putative peptidoglycan lipid II flippase